MLISLLFLSVSSFQVFNTILHLLYIYGTDNLLDEINTKILNLSINYIVTTKRFEGPLF